ncbi:MAG: restriction endonuclease subunit S [Methanomicrobiales archaeon]|nr:restriction endonuclease subunit S [Methanomicrobiales archaeon]
MKEGKLPEGWEWKRLDESANLIMGQSPPGESYNESGEGTPFLQGNAEFGDTFPNHKKFTSLPSKISPKGSVLLSVRAPVGDINIADLDYCIGRGLASISLKKGENKYLFYLLKGLQNQFEDMGTGSTFKAITKSILSEIKIPLPPLPTQRQIVAILEQAETTKRLRAESDELTQRFLQSVFMEMFGDPVKNEKGWKTEKLVGLCLKHFGGGTPSKSKPEYYIGDIPWVSPKDMKSDFIWDSIDHISEDAITNSSTQKAPIGTLLMVIRSAILKKYLPVAITRVEVTINQDMKAFVFDEKRTNAFFMFYFFKSYQKALLTKVRAVTADNIEFNQIKSINVIVPPLPLQQEFARIVEQVEALRERQQQSAGEINLLFGGLMQKAFTGELVA